MKFSIEIFIFIELINLSSAATIEISGIRSSSVSKQVEPEKPLVEKKLVKQNRVEDIDESLHNNSNSLLNADEDDSSILSGNFNVTYTEKFVDIERPYDYNLRGFGFLLQGNGGDGGKEKKNASFSNDPILSQNYAEIVAVEKGS